MGTITPLAAALLTGGALAGGAGGAISASAGADAAKDAAKEAALGPIRGGTNRAGNRGAFSLMPNSSIMSRLGENSIPMASPAAGQPIDMSKLFEPKTFGTGFSNSPSFTNVPRKFS